MINIGINENVVLHSAKTNDKGWLVLAWKEAKDYGKEKKSLFAESQTAAVSSDDRSTEINLFPFKKPDGKYNEGKTDDELLEMIGGDIKKLRNQLTQALEQYIPLDKIKWDPYVSTGVTDENHRVELMQTSTLESVFANYANQFVQMVSPFLGDLKFAVRIKLIRQSKDKNFMAIPGRFLDEMPWIETMEVPADRSRVKFSQWEIDNGYNSSAAVNKAETDKKDEIPDTEKSKESVFGKR